MAIQGGSHQGKRDLLFACQKDCEGLCSLCLRAPVSSLVVSLFWVGIISVSTLCHLFWWQWPTRSSTSLRDKDDQREMDIEVLSSIDISKMSSLFLILSKFELSVLKNIKVLSYCQPTWSSSEFEYFNWTRRCRSRMQGSTNTFTNTIELWKTGLDLIHGTFPYPSEDCLT